jgi:hypothetical protein
LTAQAIIPPVFDLGGETFTALADYILAHLKLFPRAAQLAEPAEVHPESPT